MEQRDCPIARTPSSAFHMSYVCNCGNRAGNEGEETSCESPLGDTWLQMELWTLDHFMCRQRRFCLGTFASSRVGQQQRDSPAPCPVSCQAARPSSASRNETAPRLCVFSLGAEELHDLIASHSSSPSRLKTLDCWHEPNSDR